MVQQGLSLEVTYGPATGQHATVRQLLFKIDGLEDVYTRVTVNLAAGNTIDPFLPGQVVKLRTDVGNSRDFSELGEEQTVTIAPAP